MRIEVIESHEVVSNLKANWDAVYERDPEAHFFLSWAWLSHWLDDDDTQWFILAAKPAKSDAGYVAFFPLRLRAKMRRRGGFYNEITLAGRGLSDYTGLIALPEFEEKAIQAFGHYLLRSHWAVLNLEFLRLSPKRLKMLLRHFPAKSFRINEIETINKRDNINNSICPFAKLPEDWDSYLERLGSNTRQKMRRFLRKLGDGGEYRVTLADAATIERDLDILLDFWSIKWAPRKGDRIPGLVRTNRDMFMRCFEAGALFVPVMWRGEKPLAALASYVDRKKKALLFFMGARDETIRGGPPAGFVLHAYSIRHAIENGFRTYDFLRGNEEYKYMFGVDEVMLRNFVITTTDHRNLNGRLDNRSVLQVLKKTLQLHKAERINEAELGYRQVLDVSPQSATALYGYGQLLAKRGDHRTATRTFRKLVGVKPEEPNAWLRLGVSLEAGKRFADAAKAYEQTIKLRPNGADAYMQLGRALLALGRNRQASAAFEMAAQLRPDAGSPLH